MQNSVIDGMARAPKIVGSFYDVCPVPSCCPCLSLQTLLHKEDNEKFCWLMANQLLLHVSTWKIDYDYYKSILLSIFDQAVSCTLFTFSAARVPESQVKPRTRSETSNNPTRHCPRHLPRMLRGSKKADMQYNLPWTSEIRKEIEARRYSPRPIASDPFIIRSLFTVSINILKPQRSTSSAWGP